MLTLATMCQFEGLNPNWPGVPLQRGRSRLVIKAEEGREGGSQSHCQGTWARRSYSGTERVGKTSAFYSLGMKRQDPNQTQMAEKMLYIWQFISVVLLLSQLIFSRLLLSRNGSHVIAQIGPVHKANYRVECWGLVHMKWTPTPKPDSWQPPLSWAWPLGWKRLWQTGQSLSSKANTSHPGRQAPVRSGHRSGHRPHLLRALKILF